MAFDYKTLLSGSYWGGIEVTAKPTIVTFSFPAAGDPPAYVAGLDDPNLTAQAIASWQAFSADEQALARQALGEWANACGLVFIEVPAGQGDINFQKLDFSGTGYDGKGGIAYRPFGDWNGASYPYFTGDGDAAGDVFMNSDVPVTYGTLLHEIGHAIGLKHPTEPVTDTIPDPDVTHPYMDHDDPRWSIMSELPGGTGHLTGADKQAVREIYGTDARDPRYTWDEATLTLTQHGGTGADAIRGSSVIDVITGGAGDDRLYGLADDDTLNGGAGNDVLDGGAGTDRLIGGAGDDLFYVDSATDTVVEAAGGGYDTVIATAGYRLAAGAEQLQFWGDTPLTGYGNALDNTIFGNAGGSILFGLDGADYVVGGVGGDVLNGGDGGDRLWGEGGADRIVGGAGADYAEGGAGADRFQFTAFGDIAAGDVIGDFSHADRDRIDLRAIDADPMAAGDQAFSYLGGGAFTGSAGAAELRWQASGSEVQVQIDTNHDRVADYSFTVRGETTLVAGDYLL